jgi:hypothetical protein
MFHDLEKQEAKDTSECIQNDIINIELPDSQANPATFQSQS